jgi:tetratricopeptide (TPR) repeat protein
MFLRQLRSLCVVCALAASTIPGQEVSLRERIIEGQRLQLRGDFSGAERMFLEVLRDEERSGTDLRAIAAALDNLAGVNADLGRYSDAERLALRALAAVQKATGPRSALTARMIWSIAGIYVEAGCLQDADQYQRRFEAIAAVDVTSDPVGAAENLGNLGLVYISRRAPARAWPLFQQAVEILEKQSGVDPVKMAGALTRRAAAAAALGHHEDALADISRAWAIINGLTDPAVRLLVEVSTASGMVHAWAKRFDEAERCLTEAARLAEIHYGPGHPVVAAVFRNHAAALRLAGDKKRAGLFQKRAERILEASGHSNPIGHSIDLGTLGLHQR